MTEALVFVGYLAAGVAVYAILTLPSWMFSSMNRSTLWRLRDDVFDSRRRGTLPDSPDVEALVKGMELLIIVLPQVTAAQLWWFRRHHGEYIDKKRGYLFEEQARVPGFKPILDELGRIVMRQYMFGSWSGLLLVASRHRRHAAAVLRHRIEEPVKHWSDCGVVEEVDKVVPHLAERRAAKRAAPTLAKELIAAGRD